ncbi:MAG: Alpha/Beta hydrolase protein [Monoraphidium minutum]|nr:MAG: Alpha/Beta hydrolase protein [Monoraphidium minutum]
MGLQAAMVARIAGAWPLVALLLSWQALLTSCVSAPAAVDTHGMHDLSLTPPFERMASLVTPHGYPLEEHFVTTEDGYILRLFRVPHGRGPPPRAALPRPPRPVVHLQHGLLGASSDWALNGPGFSLLFILADAGYDVWLGNVRANAYSRNHTTLGFLDPAFWAFTWDDIAGRDLPAMLARELEVAGAESLAYVGHSQGTTVALALLSSQPHWARRIRIAVLLAPVAFATHIESTPLVALAKLNTDEVFTLLGLLEFLPSSEVLSRLDGQLCRFQPHLCVNLLAMICGYNDANVDTSRLPIYLNYTPSGTSVQNMAHWCQAMRSHDPTEMTFFDFGTRCTTILGAPRPCNQRRYGTASPPRYNFSAIAAPLALFTGGQDRLADPADAALLLAKLPRGRVLTWHSDADYEHLDYLWGVNAHSRVYGRVMALLEAHGGGGSGGGAGREGGGGGGGGGGVEWRRQGVAVLARWWRRARRRWRMDGGGA